MPLYVGDAVKDATKPTSGLQAGKWQCIFTPSDIAINLPAFECYRIVIASGPPGSTFEIFVNNKRYDSVFPGDVNSWDPNNPMKLSNGDSITFNWNTGAGTTTPEVTLYFQQPAAL